MLLVRLDDTGIPEQFFFFATHPPINTCLIISLYLEADWFFLFNVWLSNTIQEFGLFLVMLYLAPLLSYVLLLSLLWAYFPSSLRNKQFEEWHLLQDCGSLLPSGSSLCPSNHLAMLAAKCCLLSKWDDESFRKKISLLCTDLLWEALFSLLPHTAHLKKEVYRSIYSKLWGYGKGVEEKIINISSSQEH